MSWVTPQAFAAQVIDNFRNLPGGEYIAVTDAELEACVIMAFEHFDPAGSPATMSRPLSGAAPDAGPPIGNNWCSVCGFEYDKECACVEHAPKSASEFI